MKKTIALLLTAAALGTTARAAFAETMAWAQQAAAELGE